MFCVYVAVIAAFFDLSSIQLCKYILLACFCCSDIVGLLHDVYSKLHNLQSGWKTSLVSTTCYIQCGYNIPSAYNCTRGDIAVGLNLIKLVTFLMICLRQNIKWNAEGALRYLVLNNLQTTTGSN